jgi:ribosomal protein S18 acetylase RimI-like enzyme
MPSLDVYIHPDPTSSLVPHLKVHLPHASTELYVVQVPPAPDSTIFATFPPDESPADSEDWVVGVLGITGLPETEFWFWSSTEGRRTINVDEDREECFRSACAQFGRMLKFISNMYPEKETLLVGSLHSRIASYLPISRGLLWNKLVFSKDYLPPPDHCAQVIGSKYIFRRMADEDLDDVVQTSTVARNKTTLAAASNTGAYLASSDDEHVKAWCFVSREGAISSVYVRPEARGTGLGKETVRKELEKQFVHHKYVMIYVSSTNTASLRLCQLLGARWTWDVFWVNIQLSQFRDK